MVVLDIDLDFFVAPIFCPRHEPTGRLDPAKYSVWSVEKALAYVEARFQISRAKPTRGAVFEDHVEAYGYIVENRFTDIRLVHVDAHSDLGLGDYSMQQICLDLLHRPVSERRPPWRGPDAWVRSNNWLAFLLAQRVITALEMVFPDDWDDRPAYFDIPRQYWRLGRAEAGSIELPILSYHQLSAWASRGHDPSGVGFEPEIGYRRSRSNDFKLEVEPDVVLLTRSPNYTPPSADKLYDSIAEFIEKKA